MRDLFILAFLPYLLYLVLQRPFIGAALWIWTSMFVPAGWVWGIATGIRYNLVFAAASLISYALYKDKAKVAWPGMATLAVLFYLWFSLSTALSLSDSDVPFMWWDTFTRVMVLFLFCQLVLTRKVHWDTFLWAMLLALGGYGALEGVKFVVSGMQHLLEGIYGGEMHDRNAIAVAFCSIIPIAVYLRSQSSSKFIRTGLVVMLFFLPIAVIGTQSRAGLITLLALALIYLGTSGRRFIPVAIAISILAFGASYVVTDAYLDRSDTIREADQDGSFMGRVAAWKLSVYIALDRPLVGGGPLAVETPDVWPYYEGRYDPDEWVSTGPYENATRAAHSIFFQVLGDMGFVGFGIYMSMLVAAFSLLRRIIRYGRVVGDPGISSLGRALGISLTVYLIGGASLSIAYLEFFFALLAVVAAAGARCRLRLSAEAGLASRFMSATDAGDTAEHGRHRLGRRWGS